MDPIEILNVRFHLGGEFIHIGPKLDYVGGDEELSEIERDKLSLQEVKGFLSDHVQLKESMKLYFQIPGKEMVDGLIFLHNDTKCVEMAEYILPGGFADVFVEYHGEEDSVDSSSCSDFEDEMLLVEGGPDTVITADDVADSGVNDAASQPSSQICNPSEAASEVAAGSEINEHMLAGASNLQILLPAASDDSDDSSEASDPEYVAHSEDSGEDSEVVELRRHARKFKKKMRDTKSWIGRDTNDAVPIDLIANMEEQLEGEHKEWDFDSSDEDYSYDEDSEGKLVRRKSMFPRFNNDSEIPMFQLSMVFRSKNQLVKALKRYGIVTKRSIVFKKSEGDRVRASY